MYSFYGGRPGNSFVIVTTYQSINDMINAFMQGPNYTAVHYNEHVLISTPNKNDSNNGKIFRRGYNYQNDMGGAEYIGQIVGPAGPAPNLQIKSLGDINSIQPPQGSVKKPAGTPEEPENTGSWSISNNGLIPGKQIDNNGNDIYHDTINWKSFTIRKSDNSESTAYIGLQIPYPVIEFKTTSVETYDSNNDYIEEASSITRIDDQSHPFYEKWNINIPKGVKGDSFEKLRIEEDQSDHFSHLYYIVKSYDQNSEGTSTSVDLGTFNTIKNISINEDGTVEISYTGMSTQTIENKIKWIKNIQLSEEGTLTVNYNTTHKEIENGEQIDKYDTIAFQNAIKWIDKLELTADGRMYATYNYPVWFYQETVLDDSGQEQIIEEIQLLTESDRESYQQQINDGEISGQIIEVKRREISQQQIQWITKMRIGEMGVVQVQYNTDNTWHSLADSDENPIVLKFITKFGFDEQGFLIAQYNKIRYKAIKDDEEIEIEESQIDEKKSQGYTIEEYSQSERISESPVKWITGISQINGDLIIQYNTTHKETNEDNEQEDVYDTTVFKDAVNIPIDLKLEEGKLKAAWANARKDGSGQPIDYNEIGNVDSIVDTVLDSKGNLLFKFASGKGNTLYSKDPDEEKTLWQNVGVISPGAYGFNSNHIEINGLYLLGYLKESESDLYEGPDLHFNISPSYLLPTTISDVDIDWENSQEIQFSEDNFQTSTTIPINSPFTGSSGINGFNFIFQNVLQTPKENITPVGIYIEKLVFQVELESDEEVPDVEIDWQQRLQNLEELTDNIKEILYPNGSVNQENNITALQRQLNNTSNTVLSIQNKVRKIDVEGQLNASVYGGTNILNSLQYLKKPGNHILIPRNMGKSEAGKNIFVPNLVQASLINGDGENGRFMMANSGWTARAVSTGGFTTEGSYNINSDTQALIFIDQDRISEQQHGYVLQWNEYDPSTSVNNSSNPSKAMRYIFTYIPKDFVNNKKRSIDVMLFGTKTSWSCKTLFIYEKTIEVYNQAYPIEDYENSTPKGGQVQVTATVIQGHPINNLTSVTFNGITFNNRTYVLSGVYGV